MNPVIIIPTFWSKGTYRPSATVPNRYDHMTSLAGKGNGELPRCLNSLRNLKPRCPIILLVVSENDMEVEAAARVRSVAVHYPELDMLVLGEREVEAMRIRLGELGLGEYADTVKLSGYGSIRNVGLLAAAVLGFEEAIFIDDDEIVDDADFVERAVYGLGKLTKRGVPILAKSGFYLDRYGSYRAAEEHHWYDAAWSQNEAFNQWIDTAMEPPRLSPSHSCCGGCMAVHREVFKRVAFDPWITRGEDLDYLISLRMYGFDVWFDNTWSLRHLPPASPSESARFTSNVYRWMYEQRKIEYGRTQIDLLPVRPEDLYPYPGPLLEPAALGKLSTTAALRSVGRPEHGGYAATARHARSLAEEYADANCTQYFHFQLVWPELVAALMDDRKLAGTLASSMGALKQDAEQRHRDELREVDRAAREREEARKRGESVPRRSRPSGRREGRAGRRGAAGDRMLADLEKLAADELKKRGE